MADGAAEVEDLGGLELRELELDETGDRLADIVEVLAHQPEREYCEAVVIQRPGRQVPLLVLAVVVAGHEVDIERRHAAGGLESGL